MTVSSRHDLDIRQCGVGVIHVTAKTLTLLIAVNFGHVSLNIVKALMEKEILL